MIGSKTALLIFIRTLEEEVNKKTLFQKDTQKNIRLFKRLNRKIKRTASETSFDHYTINSSDQVGATFEQRYQNAIRTIFSKGYDRVICVGNDSPQITSSLLEDINEKLNGSELVYGATKQGGIYTLGLTKKGFRALDFKCFPWQSKKLANTFDTFAIRYGYIKLDREFRELNTTNDTIDFIRFLQKNYKISGPLIHLFECIECQKKQTKKNTFVRFQLFIESILILRGPPGFIGT